MFAGNYSPMTEAVGSFACALSGPLISRVESMSLCNAFRTSFLNFKSNS